MSPVSRDKKYYELLKQLIGTLHNSTAVVQALNEVELLIHIYTVCPRPKGSLYSNSFLRFSWSCHRRILWRCCDEVHLKKSCMKWYVLQIESLSKCFIKFKHVYTSLFYMSVIHFKRNIRLAIHYHQQMMFSLLHKICDHQ